MTKRQLYHILNGLWAGIPWCCIKFWHDGNSGLSRKGSDSLASVAQYVRCNKCIKAGHMVSIRFNGNIAGILIGQKPLWIDTGPAFVRIKDD